MTKQKLISVCIPTYEMGGIGHVFLEQSLDILTTQTFKDFDVIISDFSKDTVIKKLCEKYKKSLSLSYHKNTNPIVGMSTNTNNAIQHATGKLIKILFQDDFLYDSHALQHIADNFDLEKDTWMATACEHTTDGKTFYKRHYAKYNKKVYLGKNTIGAPSVIVIKNDNPMLFDLNLRWLVDCDYYRRYFDTFGKPKIIRDVVTVIRTGDHQITNTEATDALRKSEYEYMLEKYKKPKGNLQLKNVTLVTVSGLDPTKNIKSMEYSMDKIDYGEAVLVAHTAPDDLNEKITFKPCKKTDLKTKERGNTNDYSKFMLYELYKYVDCDYALIVHHNAHVVRPEKWDPAFLEYDYIGPPWAKNVHYTNEGVNVRVGNGGFSLRSKKLLKALVDLKLPFTDNGTGFYHEDGVICVYYRKQLEDYGIKFAPPHLAAKFGLEHKVEETDLNPFGFHDNKKAIPPFFYARYNARHKPKKK